ncbi:tRNA (adenosine(37)-N6)-threonylcarbamoyltransferase complex ATPase subunit type 1 TsaE [Metamycoplasma hyosynoviae]|uniref:tRNA (adenosine(37)-N6)-threonylcarbamoyltransferase complex ATPase subunit type 1 TsaE n=1 Tax=Metamycoplasma hyosynoviae TaxID=29559 RepID=UPI00235903E8|nr:tRNA (adenosine(37)-N6)-threonylcarbamoyltransferase complex ATPase subunit type 1 TsaE [Metamycoplasma hyosynoviae]MDC8900599.1 tRNA (adenosine(37)-N6)-threonylcarbamoyltransferase complex ATPase subunit type 1 TsaE [Metamycoplasma hyosynoviae]MDD1359937.1 tRNA (adenosine(37)-N6)-threonylcarbamoyltransferase complex ATPase subunit type 1 TsaE [Metamycoplasma hyosynoviae]MDD1378847.1 tRNA (adenosine(37)-N6)-threonylcarbamoyltransferase complex ATPase subunit type 1 TsaE [Metamycoplasma hyosyn
MLNIPNLQAILLNGELGSGKTTLAKAIAKQLGEKKTVISPTFNSILIYDKLVHIDAYKMVGNLFPYEEYFEDKLVIIEWADKITHSFTNYVEIEVYVKDGKHIFEIKKEVS